MNSKAMEAVGAWKDAAGKPDGRTRRRDFIPPLAAIVVLTVAHLLSGATHPIATLALSACLVCCALASLLLAGPRHVTAGMIVGLVLIWTLALAGFVSSPDQAAPELASLFAAGAMWSIGYVCARSRGALDIAWKALILSSFGYCILVFSSQASAVLSSTGQVTIADAFRTPAEAALMFGLLAVVGWSRILHVLKQMDAKALARSAMVDHLLRHGLGGILLMAFSLTCLTAVGSVVGALFVAAAMIGHAWWDMHAVLERDHRSILMRIVARLAPLVALGLAGWGVYIAWFHDESVALGVGLSETPAHVQRFMAYFEAWRQQPLLGYGIGSIESVGDSATTLWNAKAMLAPGGAQNVFLHWIVEVGAVGAAAIILVLAAIHFQIFTALGSKGMPRTFLRLAVAAGFLLLLHGVSDTSLDIPSIAWLYALLLGAACGVATSRRSERFGAIG
jgi:O-antigen ligase